MQRLGDLLGYEVWVQPDDGFGTPKIILDILYKSLGFSDRLDGSIYLKYLPYPRQEKN
jgi:hypothetical protein